MGEDLALIAQVSNVSTLATLDQMEKLFGFMGKIKDIRMYPTVSVVQPQFKVCYIKYAESWSVRVAMHLTNTVFIDRALVVVAIPGDRIPSEDSTSFDLLNPASALPGLLSSGIKDVSNEIAAVDGNLVITSTDTNLDILGLPQYPPLSADQDPNTIEEIRRTIYIDNISSQVTATQLLDFINGVVGEVKYLRMAGIDKVTLLQSAFVEFTDRVSIVKALQCDGITLKGNKLKIQHSSSAIVKPQKENEIVSEKDTEEAMKRLKEAESLIARVVEPEISGKRSRRRSSSRSRRRSSSRTRRRSRSASRRSSRKRDKRSRSRDRKRRSTSRKRRTRSRSISKVRRSRSRSRPRRSRSRSKARRSKRSYSRSRRSRSKTSVSKSKSSKKVHRSRSRSPHSRSGRSRRSRSRSNLARSKRSRRSRSRSNTSKRGERSRSRSRLSRSKKSRSSSRLGSKRSKRSGSKSRGSPKKDRSRSSASKSKDSKSKAVSSRSRSREPVKPSADETNDGDKMMEITSEDLNSQTRRDDPEGITPAVEFKGTKEVAAEDSALLENNLKTNGSSLNFEFANQPIQAIEVITSSQNTSEGASIDVIPAEKLEEKVKSRSRSRSRSGSHPSKSDKGFRSRSRDRKRTKSPVRNIRKRRSYSSSDSSSPEFPRTRDKKSVSRHKSRSPRRSSKHSSKRSVTPVTKRSKRSITPPKRSKRSISPRKRSKRSPSPSSSKYRSRDKKSHSRRRSISGSPVKRSKSRSPMRSVAEEESDKEAGSTKEGSIVAERKRSRESPLKGSDSDM